MGAAPVNENRSGDARDRSFLAGLVALFVVVATSPLPGQTPADGGPDDQRPPARGASLLLNLENTLVDTPPGWIGVQGEVHLADERLSAFGSLGFTPAILEVGDPSGLSYAVGARGYTRGRRHRVFLEASWRQVGVGLGKLLHGPGFQVGYQFTAPRGFTLLVSGGAGYAVDAREPGSPDRLRLLMSLGIGHTWR